MPTPLEKITLWIHLLPVLSETNARVGIKLAAQNVLDVSTVVALSYALKLKS